MYSQLTLVGLGLFGVLMHCFVELHKLNKKLNGNAKIKEYLRIEVFSILISISMAIASSFIGNEIKLALEKIGYEWLLGVAFITIGYMGQSLLIFVMGRAANKIGDSTPPNSSTDETDSSKKV